MFLSNDPAQSKVKIEKLRQVRLTPFLWVILCGIYPRGLAPYKGTPMSKEAYYFSHDANAQNDPKMIMLRRSHDWFGIGVFWAIIEDLRNEPEFKLEVKNLGSIAWSKRIEEARFKGIMESFFELKLLVQNEVHFWSESLLERMEKKAEISKIRSEMGRKGAIAKQLASKSLAKSSKGKEKKGKESKGKEILYPSLFDISEYVKEKNLNVKPQAFFDYYTADGDPKKHWIDAKGNKVKSWKQKILTWNMHANENLKKNEGVPIKTKFTPCPATDGHEDGREIICASELGHAGKHNWKLAEGCERA